MTIQSDQVEQLSEVQDQTSTKQVDAIVDQIRRDSRSNSQQYIEETTVPRGGE